jgi:peroxiredoxin
MNRFSFIAAGLLVFGVASAAAEDRIPGPPDSSYTLTGVIEGLDKGWAYLMHETATPHTDSAKVEKGHFRFSGLVSAPEFCRVDFAGPRGDIQYGPGFFLQCGSLALTGRKDAFQSAVISGGPIQDEYRRFDDMEKTITSEEKQKQAAKAYIRTHPSSYVAAFALDSYFSYNPDADELDSLYNGLDAVIRNSFLGRQAREVLDAAKLTAPGRPAPAFTQNDANGRPVTLSSFQGNYVLVDFWASWCGPCRLENPTVVKAWRQYHSKGFVIIGVSLDSDKDKWLAAIKKDGLEWTQVSDLKGWDNQVAGIYGIKGIPMNFLLDKNGKVVAKGLTGDALDKKLADLLP